MHAHIFNYQDVLLVKSANFLVEICLYFLDFSTNKELVLSPFSEINTYLLKNQNGNQVGRQLTKVTHPVGYDVVGDVRVNELELVHLVDQTVFVCGFIAMVLVFN